MSRRPKYDDRPTRPRDYSQTGGIRPPSPTTICTVCSAHFVDDDPGRRAHIVVMGHQPRKD